jgi:hypothetical protein
MQDYKYDVFISHAWEDKGFVRPLAEILRALGLKVWYDEFTLQVGDSLSRSIDAGLAESRYGLVVISPAFFKKQYPQHELRGLVARQTCEGRKVILPIWCGVTRDDVAKFSPSLVDQLAIHAATMASEDIGLQILAAVRPDIYRQYERDDLLNLYKQKALHELHDELMQLREDLSEFQCPHCGALMEEHAVFGNDEHEVERTSYRCGYALQNSEVVQACPHDPDLPAFDEFDIQYFQFPDAKWYASGRPRTKRAKHFGTLSMYSNGAAKTKEHATELVHATYLRKVRPREWAKFSQNMERHLRLVTGPDGE